MKVETMKRKILTAITGAHRLAIAKALWFPAENYHKHKIKSKRTTRFLGEAIQIC